MKNDPFAPNLLERLPAPPQKVVLLCASRIGDFLCAVPALRALRARLPDAEISMITLPLLHDLARRLPALDKVLPFPGFPGIAEHLFEARPTVHFLQQAQREHFDLAIQMQGTGVYSNPFVLLLGARATAGFVRPGDQPGLLTAALPHPHHLHEIHCVLALTDFLGAPSMGEELEFPLTELERLRATTFLEDLPRPWIGIHPSSRDPERCWPLKHYVSLAEQLLARQGGTLLLFGDAEAQPAGQFIEQRLPEHCVDLAGKVSLLTLGALIEQLSLLITNDSGPAHIAYALHTSTITLFSKSTSLPTNGPLQPGPFRLLYPQELALSASSPRSLDQTGGIQHISVPQVLHAAEELLQEARHRAF
ncbi:MAG TPA: glycosyltransferase family 9 protein [Ktedonobacteraceae bacterium]|nr:glycosyltransferase family 9 protein [Ktedonobacteraceae bacterium]